ncbi:MAG: Asp23/Gls24 family envelope stress response protein [Chloroflexota bacterium]|nr:Asp23/Gls24 family envelope stress response protein [Chloroflexota bacterium]
MGDTSKDIMKQEETKPIEERFQEQEMTAKIAELESGTEYTVGGITEIEDEVVSTICATAAREVDGVANVGTSSFRRTLAETFGGSEKKARGVTVEQGRKEVIADLTIQVIYGFSIPQIVIEVRRKVGARLLEMAGLIAKDININVTGLEFPDRMPGRVE